MSSRPSPRLPFFLLFFSSLSITVWGAKEAVDFLVPLSFAALLAFLMAAIILVLKRCRVPEPLAILLSVFVILTPLLTLGYFLSREIDTILKNIPQLMNTLEKSLTTLSHSSWGTHMGLDHIFDGGSLRTRAAANAGEAARILLQGVHTVVSLGSDVALVILLAIVMVISRHSLRRGIDQAFDQWGMRRSHAVLDEAMVLIERFLLAKLGLLLFVASMDLVLFWLFSVNFFIILAVCMGVMTLIPAVGFVISVIPALLLCLLSGNSPLKTAVLFLGLAVVSSIETHVLTPQWVGRQINLNLLSVFIGLFAGERLWGISGMFLSLPLLAIMRILFSTSPRLKPLSNLLANHEGHHFGQRPPGPGQKKVA